MNVWLKMSIHKKKKKKSYERMRDRHELIYLFKLALR